MAKQPVNQSKTSEKATEQQLSHAAQREYPVYLTIHGHFYQPPRENPWCEQIETQSSASPYHDWNARINDECYRPNSISRVLDSLGRIDHIVNNFEYISFNIGPTLISWIESHDPHTYQRILDADKKSMERNNGHGNAIAQVYNHIIMPLANKRDKETQIRWGIADFEKRFKRKPEGMWLAETAINRETVECLIDAGIRFTILSPTQAERFRPFKGEWQDVSNASIDTKRPYRIYSRRDKGKSNPKKYLDVFFYDGPVSQAVAFEHLLTSAQKFAEKMVRASRPDRSKPQLVNISTDGESYGHHEKFGDMCLAFFYYREAQKAGFTVTNYANYLEMYPPQHEVELKNYDGEGTAWSCSHGVGRWYRNCGCSTGAQANWNQEWRTPLRSSFDKLRDAMIPIFEQQSAGLLKDCWKARDAYIKVMLDRSPRSIKRFFTQNAARPLSHEEEVKALRLLEGQRQALLMYTSCAWFFADISGLETTQVIKYAARAIQLYQPFSSVDLERIFLSELQHARSNLGTGYNGIDIYLNWIKPNIITPQKIVHQYGVNYLILKKFPPERLCMHTIAILDSDYRPHTFIADDEYDILFLHLEISDLFTREKSYYLGYTVRLSFNDFRSFVREIGNGTRFDECKDSILTLIHNLKDAVPYEVARMCNNRQYTLSNIYVEESQELIQNLLETRLEKVNRFFIDVFHQNIDLIGTAATIGIALPPQLKMTSEQAIEMIIMSDLEKHTGDYDLKQYGNVFELWKFSKDFGLTIATTRIRKKLSKSLNKLMLTLQDEYSDATARDIKNVLEIAQRMDISLELTTAQNVMFEILSGPVRQQIEHLDPTHKNVTALKRIHTLLILSEHLNFNTMEYRNRVNEIYHDAFYDQINWQ